MLSIRDVTLTPNPVTTGQTVLITVTVVDVNWNQVKVDFSTWDKIKTTLSNWKALKERK